MEAIAGETLMTTGDHPIKSLLTGMRSSDRNDCAILIGKTQIRHEGSLCTP